MAEEYIYIVQATLQNNVCKIGKTNNLERGLKEYTNSEPLRSLPLATGKSKTDVYSYLFSCEVSDMAEVEADIKAKFGCLIMLVKDIPTEYKTYDDEGTLLVDKGYIPANYKHPFAVSVRPILNGLLEKGFKIIGEKEYRPYLAGKEKHSRVLVQRE
ncbi:MAG: GIY-YIG nuclease family protein [Spirochaetaceae bacterium]|nr:GIY-YIG nuclease family protein [Spirochaetaceae bacterium]